MKCNRHLSSYTYCHVPLLATLAFCWGNALLKPGPKFKPPNCCCKLDWAGAPNTWPWGNEFWNPWGWGWVNCWPWPWNWLFIGGNWLNCCCIPFGIGLLKDCWNPPYWNWFWAGNCVARFALGVWLYSANMLSLVNLDFSFSVGAGWLKKFSSSFLRSGLSGLGGSTGFSCGDEKKLENISSLAGGFCSGLLVSKPRRSAAPLEILAVSLAVLLRPSLGLTEDFGFGILGITSDFWN